MDTREDGRRARNKILIDWPLFSFPLRANLVVSNTNVSIPLDRRTKEKKESWKGKNYMLATTRYLRFISIITELVGGSLSFVFQAWHE